MNQTPTSNTKPFIHLVEQKKGKGCFLQILIFKGEIKKEKKGTEKKGEKGEREKGRKRGQREKGMIFPLRG